MKLILMKKTLKLQRNFLFFGEYFEWKLKNYLNLIIEKIEKMFLKKEASNYSTLN